MNERAPKRFASNGKPTTGSAGSKGKGPLRM